MASECKDHDHSKPHDHSKSSMPKFPKNVFFFTLFHLSTSALTTYYVSLYYAYTKPEDYPEGYFEYHFGFYLLLWSPCLVNLILSRLRNPGRVCSTDNPEHENCCKCKIQRLPRSHHCSTCNQCVLRMDHHCMWVSNCIGLYNHKNFFWYTFFTATGGTYHMFLVFSYTFTDYPPAYSGVLIKLFYFYHSFIVLFFSYFCYTLLNIQVRLILSGNTNMEYMKEWGNSLAFLKCVVYPVVRIT